MTAVPNAARAAKVLEWLRLPEAERPSFVTLYFSDVGSAGHRHGPDAPETAAAVARVDASLGEFVEGLRTLGVLDRTTIVVTSDHGMIRTSSERTIYLSDYLDPATVDVQGTGAMLAINPRDRDTAARIVAQLSNRHPALAVYLKERLPAQLHYGTHPRVPAVVGLVDAGWSVATRRPEAGAPPRVGGAYGYSPEFRDMHGQLVVAGPGVRQGGVVPEIENVNVYAVMCRALGLKPAKHDGDSARIERFFTPGAPD